MFYDLNISTVHFGLRTHFNDNCFIERGGVLQHKPNLNVVTIYALCTIFFLVQISYKLNDCLHLLSVVSCHNVNAKYSLSPFFTHFF